MDLQGYMDYLGWSIRELAKQAEINPRTVTRAIHGDTIRPWVAQRIASTLTKALKKRVFPGDIEGLHIER